MALEMGTYVAPYSAGLEMAAEVEGCEAAVADGEFFAGWEGCQGVILWVNGYWTVSY